MKNGEFRHISVPECTAKPEPVMRKKGVPCPYVTPTGEEVKSLKSLVLHLCDLSKAIDSFSFLLENEDNQNMERNSLVVQNFLFSGLVSYSKCFMPAGGRSFKLKKDIIFKDNPELLKVHDEMLRIRNKYVAHGDNSEFEEVWVRVALNPDVREKEVLTPYYFVLTTAGIANDAITKYFEVCNFVKLYIDSEIPSMYQEIKDSLGTLNIDDIYKMSESISERL